jgi:hypothetical protein
VGAPLILLKGDSGIGALLGTYFRFIGRHFLKYLTLVSSGLLLLFLPYLFNVLMGTVVPVNSTASLVIDMITDTVAILLAVIFLFALLKFYLDTSRAGSVVETN